MKLKLTDYACSDQCSVHYSSEKGRKSGYSFNGTTGWLELF